MAYRRDNGTDFGGGGFGGTFGTTRHYDPHREWEGPAVTRGVGREGSRVRRDHPDEHPAQRVSEGHGQVEGWEPRTHGGYPGGHGGGHERTHFSEYEARVAASRNEGYGAREQRWAGGAAPGGIPYPVDQQHGYGRSQYDYPPAHPAHGPGALYGRGAGTDMGLGEHDEDRGPHYGKGPKGYKRSDERIREEVCEIIARQGFVDASEVEVTVEGRIVRLTGLVATRQEKRALEQMAERVHGADEVRNEIRLHRSHGQSQGQIQGQQAATPPSAASGAQGTQPTQQAGVGLPNGKTARS